ncbi:PEP/pyruvate-binding domain-containing protein [Streptomyces hirsutus]|uniref:PEP/pyruvate-binding domain-containing protein n=1 Tax=Streptomyces hirsutus TaxID=35620 RepID=UPI000ACCB2A5|nr:PEP/pyruvate-binding domain-containing protein [Streptomyces hirsutus]
MVHYVYAFTEGGRDMAGLLGGKGANLAEMTSLGLPVPPGFTVTTEACRSFLTTGSEPAGLAREISDHLAMLEQVAGRRLGQPDDPLLLSVRSGARFSMPGMMETILDIGLNDDSVLGLAKSSGNERFAWDSYRRLVQMFGSTVMGVDSALFESTMARLKQARGAVDDLGLDAADLAGLVEAYKELIRRETGESFPRSPAEQLRRAVLAVFRSWNVERARVYRRREHIPDGLGTAVNVQTMVFGNLGPDSGSGVAFTRDPATGRSGLYGDYLPNAQGEDVVAGIRNTVPLDELGRLDPDAFTRLRDHMATLEAHYRDLCDIEFTIERGRLWMLQTRVGKRTAEAAFTIAAELADDRLITPDEGLARVSGDELARLMFPRFDTSAVAEGRAARPGLKIGVCGEHGGDPESVHFFHAAGLDYVSCSPFRVPVARLEAGRAALSGTEVSDSR